MGKTGFLTFGLMVLTVIGGPVAHAQPVNDNFAQCYGRLRPERNNLRQQHRGHVGIRGSQ